MKWIRLWDFCKKIDDDKIAIKRRYESRIELNVIINRIIFSLNNSSKLKITFIIYS